MEPNEQGGENGGAGDQGGGPRMEQARATAEKMIAQLQVMIDQTGKTAGPVLRDVAAKAAELAAVAAENAGPVAHKAASVTEPTITAETSPNESVIACRPGWLGAGNPLMRA